MAKRKLDDEERLRRMAFTVREMAETHARLRRDIDRLTVEVEDLKAKIQVVELRGAFL